MISFSAPVRAQRRVVFSTEVLESRRLLTTTATHAAIPVDYSAVTTLPTLSLSDVVITEGRRGTLKYATITATLSEPSNRNVAIGYKTQAVTATGTGSARDYAATSGTLTIKAGATSGKIRVAIIGDNRAEPDETFNVVVTRLSNASLASSASGGSFARVVIRDDDSSTTNRPTLSIAGTTAVEGNTATFTVTLSAATSRNVSVRYATEPGTASASRFTPKGGILTIPAGQTSATISVPTVNDGIAEGTQTFSLKLSTPANADIASGNATATIIDANPDTFPAMSVTSAGATEGDTGVHTINFIVTLSSAYAGTVTVHYATVDGTAIAGSDYTAASGTLTFAPGVTSLYLPVRLINDTTYEATETFSLVLSNPVNATLDQATGVGTIYDNDQQPTASITSVTADEGALGVLTPFTFTVTLSAADGVAASVDYATLDGTAVAGRDYEAASGTLSFAPGVTSETITVYVIGNNIAEPDKVFTVDLSNPVNLKLFAATAAANGTILNDDPTTSTS